MFVSKHNENSSNLSGKLYSLEEYSNAVNAR